MYRYLRAVILVPTHDLAAQVYKVVTARGMCNKLYVINYYMYAGHLNQAPQEVCNKLYVINCYMVAGHLNQALQEVFAGADPRG